ncbi:MAG: hypothetical protein ACREXR_01155 [Gammaproteobacteria bacterium]
MPATVLALLFAGLSLQIAWHGTQAPRQARAESLPAPPPTGLLRAASLGEPPVLARFVMLWLQAFDNQAGISIPFRELDYRQVIGWLERVLRLDERTQYPLLAASRVYAEVPVPTKQRQMLEFVYQQFLLDPNRRWPWMAHAAFIAKHRLKDLPLALKYAKALTDYATGTKVPHWAQQMQVFLLEDIGEVESAKVLLGGLIENGNITDPHELRFLEERLRGLGSSPKEKQK